MKYKLRPYQRRCLDQLYDWFRNNATGHPIVAAAVGAGKSIMLAQLCDEAINGFDQKSRLLMIVPSKELAEQNYEKLISLAPGLRIGVLSASLRRKDVIHDKYVILGTIGTLHKRGEALGYFDLCLIDECFIAGTMISTPNGQKPIESIKPGDEVLNALGRGNVIALSKREATRLLKIELSDGKTIIVTENHKFFTGSGWKQANEMEQGESLFSVEDMQVLQENFLSMDQEESGWLHKKRNVGIRMGEAKLLFNILLKESEQPYEQQSDAIKNERDLAKNKASTYKARREWTFTLYSTIGFITRAWRRVGVRGSDTHQNPEREWLPYLLQARYRKSQTENGDRIRWPITLWKKKRIGPQKRCSFGSIRVESISCDERKGTSFVFNLHVSGHPSYFANGALVHNCHLVPRSQTGMYRQLIAALHRNNASMRVVGWTGTAFRGNGVWLTEGKDRIFTDIAARVTMTDLLEQGFLSPLKTAKPETQISSEGMGTRQGDFIISELVEKLDKTDLIATISKEIIAHGRDRKKWLVYCVTVEHAQHMADALSAQKIACAVVSAKTPRRDREMIIARFKAGHIKTICNVAVLTTGFDVPEVDLIALVRNTQSGVLYTQIAGRGMRIAAGKTDCLWLDFTDTTDRLGPVNLIKGRSEPKKKEQQGQNFKICDECGSQCALSARECLQCQYQFPEPEPKINASISGADVIAIGDTTYPVDGISCQTMISRKTGKAYLKIIYQSGLDHYYKNLMIGYEGYAGQKAANEFINLTSADEAPETPEQAMRLIQSGKICFRPVSRIAVDIASPYKDIKKITFKQEQEIA